MSDAATGMKGILVVDSSALGPCGGGTRMLPFGVWAAMMGAIMGGLAMLTLPIYLASFRWTAALLAAAIGFGAALLLPAHFAFEFLDLVVLVSDLGAAA